MVTTTTTNSVVRPSTTAVEPNPEHIVSLIRAGAAQTTGQRDSQDDAIDIMIPAEPRLAARGSLFTLTEGAGMISLPGHDGKVVAQQVRDAFYNSFASDPGKALRSALVSANRNLHKQAMEKLGAPRAGVLCVAAAVQGDRMWLGSAGRATVYILSSRTGILHMIELHQGPRNDRLGLLCDIEPDMAGPLRIGGGDLILISSDGLYNLLPEEIVRHYMASAMQTTPALPATQLATALVNAARFRDAADNASALVLRCHGVLPASAADEYGWPAAYASVMTLPLAGEEQQAGEYPTVASLTALALRPQNKPATTTLTTTSGDLPADLATGENVEYQPEQLVETTARSIEKPARRRFIFGRVKPEHTQSNTVNLAQETPESSVSQPAGPRRLLRSGQRVAGWLIAAGAMAPLVEAPFVQQSYLVSSEGLFFLGLATAGVACSVNAARALKTRAGEAKPGKLARRKGSAAVAAQRLTNLQHAGVDA